MPCAVCLQLEAESRQVYEDMEAACAVCGDGEVTRGGRRDRPGARRVVVFDGDGLGCSASSLVVDVSRADLLTTLTQYR